MGRITRAGTPARLGVEIAIPDIRRGGEPYSTWTPVPVAGMSSVVGNWGGPNADGWVTFPETGTYIVSVTFTIVVDEGGGFLLLVFSENGIEKFRVVESNGYGVQGGTAAGIVRGVRGERFRLLYAADKPSRLVDFQTRWSIRQLGE